MLLSLDELKMRVGILENEKKNAFGVKTSELEKSMKKNGEAVAEVTGSQEQST